DKWDFPVIPKIPDGKTGKTRFDSHKWTKPKHEQNQGLEILEKLGLR
ncbi:18469_t:CDS:1, partial [Funneliformis geosporum]